MIRHRLTDEQWGRIENLVPGKPGDPGRSGKDNRLFVDAIIWMARTGAPWRDLSPFFGNWNSVWKRFRRWAKAGVWERILAALADDPDFESVIIDGTIIRAHQHAAGGKGGFRRMRSDGRVEGGARKFILRSMPSAMCCACSTRPDRRTSRNRPKR
jgi:putative transposase